MTKTKFTIDLIARGDLNDGIVRMITNHNEGKATIDVFYFEYYGKTRAAEWASVTPKFKFVYCNEDSLVCIFENDKPTLVIEERIIYEMEETEKDKTSGEELI